MFVPSVILAVRGESIFHPAIGYAGLLVVALIALGAVLRVRRVSIADGRFTWRSLLRTGSVASEDVVRFHVVEQPDPEGPTTYAVAADFAPARSTALWAAESAANARILCACLNAAIFVTVKLRRAAAATQR